MSDNIDPFWSLNTTIWSYTTHDENLPFHPARAMPPSRRQGKLDCSHHATVTTQEALSRLMRADIRPTLHLPELSIQHSVDAIGPQSMVEILCNLKKNGVTLEKNYNFVGRRGPRGDNRYDHSSWCYRLSRFASLTYDHTDNDMRQMLFNRLVHVGPFVGGYYVREGHEDQMKNDTPLTINSKIKRFLLGEEGMVDEAHAVSITGVEFSRTTGLPIGWVFQDSMGTKRGNNGFFRMDFDVLSYVFLFEASPYGKVIYPKTVL